jgi:hypothetical protein
MVQAMVDEYGAGENLRLLLALVASADRRERRLVNDIDRQELARENKIGFPVASRRPVARDRPDWRNRRRFRYVRGDYGIK